jgi:hypothetical protein
VVVGVALFWGLRIYYWSITVEPPFSDMADYLQMGRSVYHQWDFRYNEFWRTFKPPGHALLIAGSWWLAGGESLRAWQWTQTLVTFGGLLWLVREVRILTRAPWLGGALLYVVALSKPSVFWSLKYAQETLAEALIYACLAGSLWAFRRPSVGRLSALGVLYGFALLSRPQFVLYVGVFPLLLVGQAVARQRWGALADRQRLKAMVAFAGVVAVVWTPWVVRSYVLYGAFVPLSTQGPYAVLWELGTLPVDVPGIGRVVADVQAIQREAPKRFRNDYEASRYAGAVAWAWLRANPSLLPQIVADRIRRSVVDRGASGLSRVSRAELLPGWCNAILLDKNGWLVTTGLLGLVVAPIRWGVRGAVLPLFVVLPWVGTVSFIGWARYFEPSVPMVLFGNFVLVSGLVAASRWRPRSPAPASDNTS